MKELKFRAWDYKGKQMCSVLSMVTSDLNDRKNGELELNNGHVTFWKNHLKGECVIMQYTGLKNGKGIEIYEGDIVEAWSAGNRGVFEIWWRQEGSPCWLLYPNGQHRQTWKIHATEYKPGKRFIGVDGIISDSDKIGFYDDGLEIIGNIYENPELLPTR